MNGLQRNTARLFQNGGKLFVLAMDHAQTGIMEGLTDVKATMRLCADTELDGFLVNVEPARAMVEPALIQKKLILRSSFGGTRLSSSFSSIHRNHVSPETALSLGADVIKAFYTERFDEVVKNCPVPVILAGGPKERDISDVAKAAVADGVSGFAFGRNLFQAEDPPELIARLNQILRG